MKDVARLAGVSLKTVSRVVNGEPHVSPDLIAKVNVAAQQLDYRPDLTARSLRRTSRATKTLGLMLENVANPFSASLLRAVEDAGREHGLVVLAASSDDDPDQERQLVRTLLSRQVDGLIVAVATGDQSYLRRELVGGKPMVFVDRPPLNLDADTVSSTNTEGSADAVAHLIARGHRDIAFLGDRLSIPTASERLAGYRQALTRARLTPHPAHVITELHHDLAAEAAVRALMLSREPPTALFTARNTITTGAIRALRGLGMTQRVALIGFDEFELADLLDPAVAVVDQDIYEIGRTAANLVVDRLRGVRRGQGEHFRIPTRLVLRASADIPPGGGRG